MSAAVVTSTTATTAPATTGYIAGWDGVRAVAVVAVIAFHFWPDVVPGGFMGVTTFLVLAGALATLRIGTEVLETGRFDARAYATGRVRRLLPALLAFLGVVLVWTSITRPEIYSEIATDVVAAVLYITPWREMASPVGYEAAFETTPAPVLHTWSLGVEELAWILSGVVVAVSGRVRAAAIVTGAVGIAGYLIWFGEADLYYSPARLTEFAMGAVVGLLLLGARPSIPWWFTVGAGLGLVATFVLWEVTDVYAGRLLIASLLSTVVVIGAVDGPVATALSVGVLRWIGTRSYALYLWHVGVGELTDLGPVPALALTAALSEGSYRWVETPVRRRSHTGAPVVLRLVAITALVALVAGVGPRPGIEPVNAAELLSEAATSRPAESGTDAVVVSSPPSEPSADVVRAEPMLTVDRPVDLGSTGSPRPSLVESIASPHPSLVESVADPGPARVVSTRRPTSVLVVGDSTAVRLESVMEAWGEREGVSVSVAAFGGCSPAGNRWELRLDLPGLEVLPAGGACEPPISALAEAELVVASYQGTLLFQHRLPGGEWTSLADNAELQADVADQLIRMADATSGRLLVLSALEPIIDADNIDPAAQADANAVLTAVASARENVTFLDTGVIELDPARYSRSDGLHLDPEGVAAFVSDLLDPWLVVEV